MQNILSVESTKLSDQMTIESGISEIELTHRAAFGVFNSFKWTGHIVIFCGHGNNGGDGYSLALILHTNKIAVDVFEFSDKSQKAASAGAYYRDKCIEQKIPIMCVNSDLDLTKYSVIVDCIFGIGFRGDCSTQIQILIEKINKSKSSGNFVLSVDINSGLNGNSGLASSAAVKSNLTIAIGCYKPGHFLNQAKDYIDKLTCIDIGVKPSNKPYKLIEKNDLRVVFPKRKNFSHKGDYGKSVIIAGSINYTGAAKLANLSQAALLSGVGISALAVPKSLQNAVTPYLLESILYLIDEKNGTIAYDIDFLNAIIADATTIAIGPGLGNTEDILKIISHLLQHYKGTLIVDADGINSLSKDVNLLKMATCNVVLTPHLKEFSRLTGDAIHSILQAPIDHVLDFSKKYGVTLLLKGPSTIIALNDDVYIVNSGTPGMATGGSGDVLTGLVSGVCSLKTAPTLLSVAAATYIAGSAAELACKELNEYSLLPHNAIEKIPTIITSII
ncbi:MAG: NAD(P)H-hydrate dehydratase [Christensenellaceae bacterium]|jgi:NAD(P)H-hydrate epimerase|nr:NAD(P)H-hydrate dehydratase [Christensenellaceae bacterium]